MACTLGAKTSEGSDVKVRSSGSTERNPLGSNGEHLTLRAAISPRRSHAATAPGLISWAMDCRNAHSRLAYTLSQADTLATPKKLIICCTRDARSSGLSGRTPRFSRDMTGMASSHVEHSARLRLAWIRCRSD